MTRKTDRLIGCIVGGAIGDGLGSAYEGKDAPFDVKLDVEWRLTDDTQLSLATCEGLTESPNPNPEIIAAHFSEWFRERRITGIGSSTLKAMKDLMLGAHWALAGRSGEMAAGNGAAMRIAPLAFCLNPEEDQETGGHPSRMG
jgi:ADP-ribosylglycohydrolase